MSTIENTTANSSVNELELRVRTEKQLHDLDVYSVADLISFTRDQLLLGNGFGPKSLNEIEAVLANFGLSLATEKNQTESQRKFVIEKLESMSFKPKAFVRKKENLTPRERGLLVKIRNAEVKIEKWKRELGA